MCTVISLIGILHIIMYLDRGTTLVTVKELIVHIIVLIMTCTGLRDNINGKRIICSHHSTYYDSCTGSRDNFSNGKRIVHVIVLLMTIVLD